MNNQSFVEINPATPAKAAVIWLHGLGADGYDFANMVPELHLPEELAIRFIFPHAPVRPITVNNGYRMRGWYDITGFSISSREDAQGIKESEQAIATLIQQQQALGIPSQKIILAGFSQGGAIALHTGLRYPEPLAGIIGLSTYLPLASTLAHERNPANQPTPLFLAHGTNDSVVPFAWAEMANKQLTAMGYAIDWHTYPIDHTVSLEEIRHISQWLSSQFNPAKCIM